MINYNGITYKGSSISISNGKVYLDGKLIKESDTESKIINIKLVVDGQSDIQIDNASTVQIYGTVNSLKTGSGDVEVMGNVLGVQTGSGNVKFETLVEGGSIKTGSGNVKYKKVKEK